MGERKVLENIPRAVKVFGPSIIITDTDTIAHGSFVATNFILRLAQLV
jgi:hypothetical protein